MADAWRRYWFGHEVLRTRLALWRLVFFGLLAVDFWFVLLPHAPRFGAADFNVSQVPFLDPYLPLPSPGIVGPLYLLGGLLALSVALGVRPRRCLALLAPIYVGVYAWSQSDSYQHHYLICLLLILALFVPAQAWTLPAPGEPPAIRSWALRLVYVQIGLMYAWTGVTKHTPVWLDGTTLDQIVTCEPREHLRWLSGVTGWSAEATLSAASVAVMVGEYLAGLIYLVRPLWVLGMGLIPLFHLGVEWLGLDIELFSYYMIGTNLILLAPDALIERTARLVARWLSPAVRWHRALVEQRPLAEAPARLVAVVAAFSAGAIAFSVPYVGAGTAGALVGGATLFVLWPGNAEARGALRFRAMGVLVAALALGATAHGSGTAYTYYRQWAGFQRRQGDEAEAARLYALANQAAGDAPARHLTLARLEARRGGPAAAVALVEEDLRRQQAHLDSTLASPTTAEAWLARGKTARALADALGFAAELWPAVGRAAEVALLREHRAAALRLAREAFLENARLDPACGAGRMEAARLGGAAGAEGAGEP
ncbi:HTTM domain-containing protein [Myxococcota bacterium]|nr:HTTM domain-containing protein [Myxococcota bacterium]